MKNFRHPFFVFMLILSIIAFFGSFLADYMYTDDLILNSSLTSILVKIIALIVSFVSYIGASLTLTSFDYFLFKKQLVGFSGTIILIFFFGISVLWFWFYLSTDRVFPILEPILGIFSVSFIVICFLIVYLKIKTIFFQK